MSRIELSSDKNPQRIHQLDGLRGLAVLFVVSFHYINNQLGASDPATLSGTENLLAKATYFGWVGVDLFFVLSGFLIGTILITNRGSVNYFKIFCERRFFRIAPIYYILLLIFFFLKKSDLDASYTFMFQNDIPLYYCFLMIQNFAMAQCAHFGSGVLTPTWSLAVEEQFYLVLPLIVYSISYFLYLFHQIVNSFLHLLILNEKIPLLKNSADIYVTTLSLATTILLAFVSYGYFEKPTIRYSHRYGYA
jgi:peptidoglycan/LPS O-acetylase OafA/YrhL